MSSVKEVGYATRGITQSVAQLVEHITFDDGVVGS